jgi:hypothetical protein
VDGVPVGDKNLPLAVAAPPGAADNLHENWNITLHITSNTVRGKQVTMGSADLVLPNGDTVTFGARKVRYSTTKGYTLSFKRGTNITSVPPAIDRRSSISIKGLKFQRSGTDWVPTAGTISYKLLGQSGTGNLLDFEPPALAGQRPSVLRGSHGGRSPSKTPSS